MADQKEMEKQHMYIQMLRAKFVETDMAAEIKNYVTNVLNKDNPNKENVIFYKAQLSTRQDEDSTLFRINFYLFSSDERFWNDIIRNELNAKLKSNLLNRFEDLRLDSTWTETVIHNEKIEPFHHSDNEEPRVKEHVRFGNVPGNNICQKFLNWWPIVPRVKSDFFDLLYQMHTFDITHQTFLPKLVHFLTIPTNASLFMSFLAQFEFGIGYAPFTVNASLICFLVLSLLYIAMGFKLQCRLLGFIATIVLCACWVTGNLWYHAHKTPENPWYNPTNIVTNPILWSYINSFIQSASHMDVPQLPHSITGVHHWESLHVFLCHEAKYCRNKCRNTLFAIMSFVCFPILSVGVSWFSWPHLIGTEVMYFMAGIGYKPKGFDKYKDTVEKAELSSDHYIDHYPIDARHLMNDDVPFVHHLKARGLVKGSPSNNEVKKSMAELMMYKRYFSHGIRERRPEDLQHMLAVSH